MDAIAIVEPPANGNSAIAQKDADDRLVALWLHGRPTSTAVAYRRDIDLLRAFAPKPIELLRLEDLQQFADALTGAPATRARKLSSVKSLLRFAARIGALRYDVGSALRVPKVPTGIANRILSRSELKRVLRAGRTPRDVALMTLFYASAMRRAELGSLRWSSVAIDEDSGDAFLSIVGKGDKPRTVRVPASAWKLAAALRRPEDPDDGPIFRGRGGAPLSWSQLYRVVVAAAKRAKIGKKASPHWLRHAHASHAFDRNAPATLVRDTLGHASLATTSIYAHSRPRESSGKYLGL